MVSDSELLRRYVGGSQTAFTELVERHVNLVYSAAVRRVGGDRQTAEEVAQAVFARCAEKAAALQDHPALSGWLHRSTRYAAIDAVRLRRRREQAESALHMEPDFITPSEHEGAWTEIRPVIDAVLDRLSERDRNAIVLRFFDGLSFADIGTRLRLSEDAARMRVDRALDKLRTTLARRGVGSTAGALGAALAANGALAAPIGLATTIGTAIPAAASVGALSMASLLLMNKLQVVTLGGIMAMGLTGVLVESQAAARMDREIAASRGDIDQQRSPIVSASVPVDPTARAELAQLQARIAELKSRPAGVTDAAILPRSAWKNVGRATPESAFETFNWAITRREYDELAKTFYLGEETTKRADAFFASLPKAVQLKYGTVERLFAPYIFSGGPKNDARMEQIDATQVIEVNPGDRNDEANVRFWIHFNDGTSEVSDLGFQRFGDEWRMGNRKIGWTLPTTPEFVRKITDAAATPSAVDSPPAR
jgi:RNA polymerase sigma factor (sigma-70 family)